MKLLTVAAACAALTTLVAAPAFADPLAQPLVAKLTAPVAAKTKIIAGGSMFVCEAGSDACVAVGANTNTFGLATCKTLSAKVGTIVSFEGFKKLDDERLADCNAYGEAKRGGGATQLAKQ